MPSLIFPTSAWRIEGNDRLTTNQLTAYILLENSTTDFKFVARLLHEMKSTI